MNNFIIVLDCFCFYLTAKLFLCVRERNVFLDCDLEL
jgi:hypothetical protein